MLDAIVILLVLLLAYVWSARGWWSSFLHMLCVLVAGALALAFWEPLAMLLLGQEQQPGFITEIAWGVSLGIPFAIWLVLLRVACDKLIPANIALDGVANLVGGGLCGLITSTVSVGMILLSVGYLRLAPDFLGYANVEYQKGSLVRKTALIFPADTLTAGFYKALSNSTLVPPDGESLGRWRPEFAIEGSLLRTNYDDGKSWQAVPPGSFEVTGRYTFAPSTPAELLNDSFEPRKLEFTAVDGTPVNVGQSQIEGYVVNFKTAARETSGRVLVGTSQVQLVVQTNDNDPYSTISVLPCAVVSQAQGDKPALGRWRFESEKLFIPSVGGRDDARMAFEFAVPKNARPIALYVKGLRVDVQALKPSSTFTSQAARDSAIKGGSILTGGGGASAGNIDWSKAPKVRLAAQSDDRIKVSNTFPLQVLLQKDLRKDLEIDDENRVIGGALSKFATNELRANQGLDRKLQIRQFYAGEDTVIVQVTVDKSNAEFGFLSSAMADVDTSKAPVLLDASGAAFSAIGYVYANTTERWIYFNPQSPITSLSDKELPTISRAQPNQQLVLLYRVTQNIKLRGFAIGDKVLAEFIPQLETGAAPRK